MCNIAKGCSEVCPEGIHIIDNALIPLKERVVDRKYDPLTWLRNTIRRRRATTLPAHVLTSPHRPLGPGTACARAGTPP